jgi:hypothetical protein
VKSSITHLLKLAKDKENIDENHSFNAFLVIVGLGWDFESCVVWLLAVDALIMCFSSCSWDDKLKHFIFLGKLQQQIRPFRDIRRRQYSFQPIPLKLKCLFRSYFIPRPLFFFFFNENYLFSVKEGRLNQSLKLTDWSQ